VRGDWQLLPWLFGRVRTPEGRIANPLSVLSRWKLFDNLRRSLFEISVIALLVAGWLSLAHPVRWTLVILALLQLPAYVDILLAAVQTPERRFLSAFVRNLGARFLASHGNTVTNLIFIPHQACLMADAIIRSLIRRFITNRHLLEWETMAQSEQAAGIGMVEQYLYISSIIWIVFLFSLSQVHILIALVCALWIVAPIMVAWLNEPLPAPAALHENDRAFLRDVALRTWRFFADHSREETHYLVPDNIQDDPPLVTHRISPTNLGLLLTSHLAAHDFGYVTTRELSLGLRRVFVTMEDMPRYRGHFLNWYDTPTLLPPAPHYVSAVDNGNLAASLTALRQGCLSLLKRPIFDADLLAGLRDHVLRLRDELPYNARSGSIMRQMASLLRHLDNQPTDLFYWEAILTETRDMVQRIRAMLLPTRTRLEKQGEHGKSGELRYWEDLLSERVDAAIDELYSLAPWLQPALEQELRVNMRDASLAPLFNELSLVPALSEMPATYQRIRDLLIERLGSTQQQLYPALQAALEELFRRLPDACEYASELVRQLERVAADASRFFEEMNFHFLLEPRRKLLRIGYNVDTAQADEACYDLLASEARTVVFLAIAKGDIPRESWFRLGRKLTGYGNRRTLISWSGTMFEYLMPLLHMRNYSNTLLDHSVRGAVEIQQLYAQQRNVPWGISESAHSERDFRHQYQYHAFGVPPLSARSDRSGNLVIAPYASMLALMVDPSKSTANLRSLAAQGCIARHGFFESIDYSVHGVHAPQFIRCFMAHHQGMGLVAIDNALLGNRMQERFHLDPLVQSTEFLLQERMPELVEAFPETTQAA